MQRKVMRCTGALALALCIGMTVEASDSAIARTSGGIVQGLQLPSNSGGSSVDQFLGVPFAHADRFEPPVDFQAKYPQGRVNATMWGPACLQIGTPPEIVYGSEDCLRVNIWRPSGAQPGTGLPVMVFIYGGSNQFGEAEPYNMSGLAAFHNVVCVSMNYRTGPIGWMAFEADATGKKSTGNWGILDIQSALRWVQREVASFGGDPKLVAIHGQSSGAGLVELQYVAPGSKGLFRGAISESGGLDAKGLDKALLVTKSIAESLGCVRAGVVNKKCLATAKPEAIVNTTYSGSWGPVTDGVTFPESPQTLLANGHVNPSTIVLGAQTNDSNLFFFRDHTKEGLPQPNSHPDGGLLPMSSRAYMEEVTRMVGYANLEKALHLYPVDEEDGIQHVHQLGNMQSDQGHCSNRQRATQFNRVYPGQAFVYRFDYWYMGNSKCLAVPNYHLPYLGAAHQDEVTFVLGQPNFMEDGSCCGVWGLTSSDCPHLEECEACYAPEYFGHEGYRGYFNAKEWAFARTIGNFWTNVAASGDPNHREVGTLSANAFDQLWPKFGPGQEVTRNIVFNASLSNGFLVEETPHGRPELCEFWDNIKKDSIGEIEQALV